MSATDELLANNERDVAALEKSKLRQLGPGHRMALAPGRLSAGVRTVASPPQ